MSSVNRQMIPIADKQLIMCIYWVRDWKAEKLTRTILGVLGIISGKGSVLTLDTLKTVA